MVKHTPIEPSETLTRISALHHDAPRLEALSPMRQQRKQHQLLESKTSYVEATRPFVSMSAVPPVEVRHHYQAHYQKPKVDRSQEEDSQLAQAFQEGDLEALAELVRRFTPLIHSYAKRLHTLAWGFEDVKQCLWALFIDGVKRYDSKAQVPLAGFLSQTVKYGHWNLFKRLRKVWDHELYPNPQENQANDVLESSQTVPSAELDVIEAWCHRHMQRKLRHALRQLDTKDLQLICTLYLKGYTMAEVAEGLGCTRQNVSRWHKRVLQDLRLELEKTC